MSRDVKLLGRHQSGLKVLAYILYFIIVINIFVGTAFAIDALGVGISDATIQSLKGAFLSGGGASPISGQSSGQQQSSTQTPLPQPQQNQTQTQVAKPKVQTLGQTIITNPQPVVAEKPKKPLLLFERYRGLDKYQSISLDLQPFGYDFFTKELEVRKIDVQQPAAKSPEVSSMLPSGIMGGGGSSDDQNANKESSIYNSQLNFMRDVKTLSVQDDYIVGPGDYVVITLWGRLEARYSLLVDSGGNISVPNLGYFKVAGMSFKNVREMLNKKTQQIVGAKSSISMGGLRMIQIYVLGEVNRPGMYPLDSMSTITNALFISGGPKDIGSLRNIELRRKNRILTKFDLYDLLLKGDKSHDLILENGDIIFVPPVGVLVGVAGNIKRPAIYELRDKFDLTSVLEIAGGVNPSAYIEQIQIDRIVNHQMQQVIDLNLKEVDKIKDFQLWDGDLVKVFTITERIKNFVSIEGNVKRPGKYEYKSGMHLSDLISKEEDLLNETFFDYAVIKRLEPPNNEVHLINFNLGKFIFDKDKSSDIVLKEQDEIYIFSTWAFKDKPKVTVKGEVRALGARSEFRKLEYQHRELVEKSNQILSRGMTVSKEMQDEILKLEEEIQQKYPYSTMLDETKLRKLKAQFDRMKASGQMISQDLVNNIDISEKLIENKRIFVALLTTRLKIKKFMSKSKEKKGANYKINSDMYNDIVNLEQSLEDSFTSPELIKLKLGELKMKIDDIEAKGMGDSNGGRSDSDVQLEIDALEQEIADKTMNLTLDSVSVPIVSSSKVKDAILGAGGLTPDALLDKGEILRNDNGHITRLHFNVVAAMEGTPSDNLELKNNDELIIHSVREKSFAQVVFVDGEIRQPGKYSYYTGMKVSDLLFMAGNTLESTFLDEAEIYSATIVDGLEIRKTYRTINLRKLLDGDQANDPQLQPYDRLFIKRIPQWGDMIFVNIDGEVKFPGKYIVKKGERLSSLIKRAGGYTDYAYIRGAVFTREKVRLLQQTQLDEMVQRLEIELLSRGSAQAASSLSADSASVIQQELNQKMIFLDRLKQIKAKGRMVINLKEPEVLAKTPFDIEVEEGDVLFIPSNPNTVQIIGSVYNQTAFVFDSHKDFADYTNLAGGYTENADSERVYILKVDGTAMRPKATFFGTRGGQKIESGDTIVVPEKLVTVSWLRDLRDITQILYQIAVTTGVMFPLLGI